MIVKDPTIMGVRKDRYAIRGMCEGRKVTWVAMGFDNDFWYWMFMDGDRKGQIVENAKPPKI